jgi:hypothetical protein
VGALPAQLREALGDPAVRAAPPDRIKLYNASNFFDTRAVPADDLPPLAALLEPFAGVTVECHPQLVGSTCVEFASLLEGVLEVAMGLETSHAAAHPRLNKQAGPDDFARAAAFLEGEAIGVRAFVLLGVPFVPPAEAVPAAIASAAFAAEHGASVVSVIPLRGGNGEMERLAATGAFREPTLRDLEDTLDGALAAVAGPAVVLADLWEAGRLGSDCAACRADRLARITRTNRTGRPQPPVRCPACAGRPPFS